MKLLSFSLQHMKRNEKTQSLCPYAIVEIEQRGTILQRLVYKPLHKWKWADTGRYVVGADVEALYVQWMCEHCEDDVVII